MMQIRTNFFSSNGKISLKFTNEIAQSLGEEKTWYLGRDRKKIVLNPLFLGASNISNIYYVPCTKRFCKLTLFFAEISPANEESIIPFVNKSQRWRRNLIT